MRSNIVTSQFVNNKVKSQSMANRSASMSVRDSFIESGKYQPNVIAENIETDSPGSHSKILVQDLDSKRRFQTI